MHERAGKPPAATATTRRTRGVVPRWRWRWRSSSVAWWPRWCKDGHARKQIRLNNVRIQNGNADAAPSPQMTRRLPTSKTRRRAKTRLRRAVPVVAVRHFEMARTRPFELFAPIFPLVVVRLALSSVHLVQPPGLFSGFFSLVLSFVLWFPIFLLPHVSLLPPLQPRSRVLFASVFIFLPRFLTVSLPLVCPRTFPTPCRT